MNTSFGNVRQIENRIGEATIALHPADAAERHLAEGDSALVHNVCGQLTLKVVISDELPRGVTLAHKGRWLRTDAASANVNVLNRGQKSDMGESTAVHSVEVSVTALAAAYTQAPTGIAGGR
jgi:anaerobic selenocysteine-containing dehydrogenase